MSQSIPIPITPPRPSSQNFSSSPHTSFSKTFPSNSSVPLHPQRATPSRTVSQILRSTLGHSVGGQGNGDDGEGSETMSVTSLISDVESEDNVGLMVRQLRVVKRALISERQKTRELEDANTALKVETDRLGNALKEKDDVMSQLKNRNRELMERIAEADSVQTPVANIDPSDAKKSRKDLEKELGQLRAETRCLNDRLRAMNALTHTQEVTPASHVQELKSENSRLSDAIEALKRDAIDRETQIKRDQSSLHEMNTSLLQQHRRLETSLNDLASRLKVSESALVDVTRKSESQALEITSLGLDLSNEKAMSKQLAKRLVIIKSRADQLELPMRRFAVTEVIGSKTRPAELLVTKNPKSHELILSITANNKPLVYNVTEILEANRFPQVEHGVSMRFGGWGKKDRIFQAKSSEEADEVMSTIRLFMQLAEERANDDQ